MKKLIVVLLFVVCALPLAAQQDGDPWKALYFLEGEWTAKTVDDGKVQANGAYTFARQLDGHIMARTSKTGDCVAQKIDCSHSDLLYIYQELSGRPLKAIYFDNEGHVIHYTVSSPAPNSALFLSEPSETMPQFRLSYELKPASSGGGEMVGKFEMRMPGSSEWKVYLAWSGARTKI